MKRIIYKIIWKIIKFIISSQKGEVIFYNNKERIKVLGLIRKIKKETEMCLADIEAYQIFMAIKKTQKIKGNIAEVGVYKGGSAKLISEAKGEKELHLFDTFEGLPKLGEKDDNNHFKSGQFQVNVKNIKNYLSKYENVFFHKGFFPATSNQIKNKIFSFVHLDVDLYKSTKDSLEFFYPRMNVGGIIISHDYINAPGVKKAFDEFFKDKPEPIIEMFESQCLIVKCNKEGEIKKTTSFQPEVNQ